MQVLFTNFKIQNNIFSMNLGFESRLSSTHFGLTFACSVWPGFKERFPREILVSQQVFVSGRGVSNQEFSCEFSDLKQDLFLINFSFEARLSWHFEGCLAHFEFETRIFLEQFGCKERFFWENLVSQNVFVYGKRVSNQDLSWEISGSEQDFLSTNDAFEARLSLAYFGLVTKLFLAPFGCKEIFGFAAGWETCFLSKDFLWDSK